MLFIHLKRHLFDRTDDPEPSKIYDGGKWRSPVQIMLPRSRRPSRCTHLSEHLRQYKEKPSNDHSAFRELSSKRVEHDGISSGTSNCSSRSNELSDHRILGLSRLKKPRRRTEFVLTDQCLLEVRQQVVLGTIKVRLTTEETGYKPSTNCSGRKCTQQDRNFF